MKTLKEDYYIRALEEFLKRCDQEVVMLDWIRKNFSHFLQKLPQENPSVTRKFLGVGCGNGIMDVEMLKEARKHFTSLQAVCIDPNQDELDLFRKRVLSEPALHGVNLEWVNTTAENFDEKNLPHTVDSNTPVDVVHMLHMLYHVRDIEETIANYFNLLREGGILMISIASRKNNQLYKSFKHYEALHINCDNSCPVERNDKRYSDDVINVLQKLGLHYSLENVVYHLDVSGCLDVDVETEEGNDKLLLDFICLTNAAQSYRTLGKANQSNLVKCLKDCCEETEEGKLIVNLTFDIITVVKGDGTIRCSNGCVENGVNGI